MVIQKKYFVLYFHHFTTYEMLNRSRTYRLCNRLTGWSSPLYINLPYYFVYLLKPCILMLARLSITFEDSHMNFLTPETQQGNVCAILFVF